MNRTRLIAAASLILVASGLLFAGPLTPPVGPVASTSKTLQEVEPRIAINATNTPGDADSLFKITAPGSYYLTGNITGVLGKSGIEIGSSRVTVDLGGFHLLGVTGSLSGIGVDIVSRSSLCVVNGIITNWGADGVRLSASASGNLVENITSSSNAGDGIYAPSGIVRDCIVVGNTGNGISSAAAIKGCTAIGNTGIGILATAGSVLENCFSRDNGGDGINASNGSVITECTARNNGGYGIIAFGDATISRCVSTLNTLSGINGQQATAILDCTSSANDSNGISVQGQCNVRGNTCHDNGNAGIFVSSVSGTRVEGNSLTNNVRGLWVTGPNNIILRNTASANTINWVINANNVVGPIINRTAPASAAISGDSAPDSAGSTHPNANFTY
ncbi:hypothetical protein BH11PLA1_BH11PLA1_19340 [soil metagenome]